MKFNFFILLFLFFLLYATGQESVFVKAIENGNGLLHERQGECFVITPNHVVSEFMGDIVIHSKNRVESKGRLFESYEPDIAIIRLTTNSQVCKPYKTVANIKEILNEIVTGYIQYVDELGAVHYVHVNISSVDQESITIIPQNGNAEFRKGMSGSAFYVNYKNEKTLMGMLMELEADLKTGYVYQIDDIDRVLAPFFDTGTVKQKNLGILILKDDSNFTQITNQLISNLNVDGKYTTLSRLPNTDFLYKEFNSILSGSLKKNIPLKLRENTDELVLGRVTVQTDKNQKNMYVVRLNLEANLYNTKDLSLIKSLNTSSKGLNTNLSIAKNQSIKSLITKLENQLK